MRTWASVRVTCGYNRGWARVHARGASARDWIRKRRGRARRAVEAAVAHAARAAYAPRGRRTVLATTVSANFQRPADRDMPPRTRGARRAAPDTRLPTRNARRASLDVRRPDRTACLCLDSRVAAHIFLWPSRTRSRSICEPGRGRTVPAPRSPHYCPAAHPALPMSCMPARMLLPTCLSHRTRGQPRRRHTEQASLHAV